MHRGRTASTAPLPPVSTRILKCDRAANLAVTDPDAVAAALARLATGAPRHREHDPDSGQGRGIDHPSRIVADAEAAMAHVTTAAAFVDADREADLRRAVELAADRGDAALAARGQAVLSTLSTFREAAADGMR